MIDQSAAALNQNFQQMPPSSQVSKTKINSSKAYKAHFHCGTSENAFRGRSYPPIRKTTSSSVSYRRLEIPDSQHATWPKLRVQYRAQR